jgi:ribose transport system ATP-binding protein
MGNELVVEMKGISKSFPGVRALDSVDFTVNRNEIVGLIGENGAGKSTLMKILIGLYKQDAGELRIRNETVDLANPKMAVSLGVGMVFQEGSLLPNLTVAENLFLRHETGFRKNGFLSQRKMNEEAKKQLEQTGTAIDAGTFVRDISAAERQMVEITRLLWLSRLSGVDNPVLILDEPTTVLVAYEIERLFGIIRELKKSSSIIFISHRLEEVLSISDRVVIFKDGKNVDDIPAAGAKIHTVEQLMVGRELAEDHYKKSEQNEPQDDVCLSLHQLEKKGSFAPASFSVHRGEILSLVGVLGSGKEELCRCIAGISRADRGRIEVNGRHVRINTPKDAIGAGIGYIPIDRRDEGLALQMDVGSNITLVTLQNIISCGLINLRKERDKAMHWVRQLNIKTPSLKTQCMSLSGGNQQKIVLSKWLAANVDVLLLDHPTRGVDVGAKEEIYKRIRLLAAEGMGIIIMSDTLEEDIGLSNRMIVLKDGEITKEILCPPDDKPRPVDIIDYMV